MISVTVCKDSEAFTCEVMYDPSNVKAAPDLILGSDKLRDVKLTQIVPLLDWSEDDDLNLIRVLQCIKMIYVDKEKVAINALGLERINCDMAYLEVHFPQTFECTLRRHDENTIVNFLFKGSSNPDKDGNMDCDDSIMPVQYTVEIEYTIRGTEIRAERNVDLESKISLLDSISMPQLQKGKHIAQFIEELDNAVQTAIADAARKVGMEEKKKQLVKYMVEHFKEYLLEYDDENYSIAAFIFQSSEKNEDNVTYIHFFPDLNPQIMMASFLKTNPEVAFHPEVRQLKLRPMDLTQPPDVIAKLIKEAIDEDHGMNA